MKFWFLQVRTTKAWGSSFLKTHLIYQRSFCTSSFYRLIDLQEKDRRESPDWIFCDIFAICLKNKLFIQKRIRFLFTKTLTFN